MCILKIKGQDYFFLNSGNKLPETSGSDLHFVQRVWSFYCGMVLVRVP